MKLYNYNDGVVTVGSFSFDFSAWALEPRSVKSELRDIGAIAWNKGVGIIAIGELLSSKGINIWAFALLMIWILMEIIPPGYEKRRVKELPK